MKTLATLYRFAQLYAHNCHHLTSGPTFFEDHEFLGELYAAYEDAYDKLVERMIGSGEKVDLNAINFDAADSLQHTTPGTKAEWSVLLAMEDDLRNTIKTASSGASIGTQNLLAGLADDSEVRSYKMQRRNQ